MRHMLTTRSQNCYREQIQKEMLTRLAWKSRYADLYPSSSSAPQLPADSRTVLPPLTRTAKKQSNCPPCPPRPPVSSGDEVVRLNVAPFMMPVSPRTRRALYQDSSQQGRGRSLYLQRRGQIRPEDKFAFPVLSSWEYGWRLGDFSPDYGTPSSARSSVVKNTFYARNGVFCSPSATDALG